MKKLRFFLSKHYNDTNSFLCPETYWMCTPTKDFSYQALPSTIVRPTLKGNLQVT